MLRDLAIALSLANLSYLRVWSELLSLSDSQINLMTSPPSRAALLAVMTNVLLLGCLLWLAITLARRYSSGTALKVARWGYILFLIIPLNALAGSLPYLPYIGSLLLAGMGYRTVIITGIAVFGLVGVALLITTRRLIRVISTTLLILFPFVFLTFIQAGRGALRFKPEAFSDKPFAPKLATDTARRVLWVIFDEWDHRLAFIDRDPGLKSIEIDRFRTQALYADNAYPPGDTTLNSIPALVTGRRIDGVATPVAPDEFLITFHGSQQPTRWSTEPNLFSKVRDLGIDTALIGWYVPYSRILNSSLTACWWWDLSWLSSRYGSSFSEILYRQNAALFERGMLSMFGQSLSARQHCRLYQAMMEKTKEVINQPEYGLVMAHFPIPHAPFFYDRSTGQFTLTFSPNRGYIDALSLVDQTVGDLRRTMENAGTWDSTTILLSSDHPYREAKVLDGKSDPRVPFLLKLAGQTEGLSYSTEFNTILTHDLLLAILKGEVSTLPEVAPWLDRHRSMFDPNP